jgi:hypothetical protein
MRDTNKLGITDSDLLFVAEYCANGMNGAQAYRKTHPRSSIAAAAVSASEFLRKPNIRAAVREWVSDALDVRKDILAKEIIDVLLKRAFFDPLDYVDTQGVMKDFDAVQARGVIDGIVRRETRDSTWVELRFADRDKALEMLIKYIELIKPDPAEAAAGTKIILLPKAMTPDEWTSKFGPCEGGVSHTCASDAAS